MTETMQINPLGAIVRDIPAGTKTLVISDAIPGQFRVSICPEESEVERDLERVFVRRADAITWAAEVLANQGSIFSAIVDTSTNRVAIDPAASTDGDSRENEDGDAA